MEDARIGLNLVTLRGGREGQRLEENLDRIARCGFGGVGLWASTINEWLAAADGRTIEQLADEVSKRGLAVHEICFTNVLDGEGGVMDASALFAQARVLGAGAVITLYGGGETDLARAQANWAEFVGKVEASGVPAAFEFVGMWPNFNSPGQAWEVVSAGPELGTIVFDTFHFWRGGASLDELDQIPAERISLVHLNDVNDLPRTQAGDKDRTFPGQGVMDLEQMMGRLLARGFTGPFSVEIFGPIQEQDPDEVVARAYQSAKALLEKL